MEIKLKFAIAPMTKARAIELAERQERLKQERLQAENAKQANAENAANAKPAFSYKSASVSPSPSSPTATSSSLISRAGTAAERQVATAQRNVANTLGLMKESAKYDAATNVKLATKLVNNLGVVYDKQTSTASVTNATSTATSATPAPKQYVNLATKKFVFKLPPKLASTSTSASTNDSDNAPIANTVNTTSTDTATNVVAPVAPVAPTFQWDESQLLAIDNILANQFNCLIGAAGSGKTTVVKEVIARLQSRGDIKPLAYQRCNGKSVNGYNIAFVSFTGKAVEQLRKSVPSSLQTGCMTIHNLLEYAPVYEDYIDEKGNQKQRKIFLPRRDSTTTIPHDIIVIDESGMVGIELWNYLWDALEKKPSLKIILIGDINQLPAVIGKSILGYALSSPKWKTSTLTKIHRQALDNPIIANAHRIIAGKMPVADPNNPKFKLLDIGSLNDSERQRIRAGTLPFDYYDKKNSELNGYKQVLGLVTLLHKNSRYDPDVDQIIVPQNIGLLGQESLNRKLAEIFNPAERTFIRAGIETKFLAIGDKVMFTSNDYNSGILNGMTGYIKDITLNAEYTGFAEISRESAMHSERDNTERLQEMRDFAANLDINELVSSINPSESEKKEVEQQASHCVTVVYRPIGSDVDATITISSVGAIRGLYLAYAITCHKAQGSEYRNVIVVCHSGSNSLLSREWLYTAVTRARDTLYLVYNDFSMRGITKALRRQVISGATIEEKAKNFSLAEAQAKSAKATGDDDNNVLVPKGV